MSEYVKKIYGLKVFVDKDGGGTLGKAYTGDWTVSVMNGDAYVYDNDVFSTGTPKTHHQVALMVSEMASEEIDHQIAGM